MVSCRLVRLTCSVVNMAVHEWSCLSGLSVDEFQDLPIQFGQVLKAKNFNRCGILLVGLGGPTLMRKTMKWESGVFPCHGMAELPRILFGHERGNFRSTRLALIAVILILLYKSMGFFLGKNKKQKRIFLLIWKNTFSLPSSSYTWSSRKLHSVPQ